MSYLGYSSIPHLKNYGKFKIVAFFTTDFTCGKTTFLIKSTEWKMIIFTDFSAVSVKRTNSWILKMIHEIETLC